jgi:hypothetical protein
VANLGDSRAVASVGGTVKQLTQALELAQINILKYFAKVQAKFGLMGYFRRS